ncbi:MAG: SDR family oxidoreductase [Halobacteriales archaeon]
MATDQERTGPPLEPDHVLQIDDERFDPSRAALVTGAASGIGRATALAFAMNGATVVGTDFDQEGLAETARKAEEWGIGDRLETVVGDLRRKDDLDGLAETADEAGALTFLANIAGLQHIDPIESFPDDQYDRIQQVMLRAPVLLAKRTMPHLRASGGGVIGNMASAHGHYVTADKVAYNVVKFGIRGLTQSIAAEYESNGGVRSFSVSTGYVSTPLVMDQIPDTAAQRGITEREVIEDVMLGQSRVKRMMSPIEVANLFVFGSSRHAAHLNGGDLLFDGGMTLTYQ